MRSAVVTWDDFSGGDYGTRRGDKAPPGTFSGNNVVLYENGTLGVRPGLRNLGVTGIPAGVLWGVGSRPDFTADQWFIIGNTLFRYASNGTPPSALSVGTLAATPTRFVTQPESTRLVDDWSYFTSHEDRTYRFRMHPTPVVEGITGSPGGRTIELYRERMLVAGRGLQPDRFRIWFSDPMNFVSWPAANFIDVGFHWPITHLVTLRDFLAILTQGDEQWVVQGSPITGILRRITNGRPPRSFAVVVDQSVVFWIPYISNAPIAFNGSETEDEPTAHLTRIHWEDPVDGQYDPVTRTILFRGGNNALIRSHGAWTYHSFSMPGLVMRQGTSRRPEPQMILTAADVGGTPSFFTLDCTFRRPGLTTDPWAQPGDNTTTALEGTVTLPERWAEPGEEIRVRQVIVDFDAWNTGSPVNSSVGVTTRAWGLGEGPQAWNTVESAEQTWTAPGGVASSTGTTTRVHFNFGEQGFGGGFDVRLRLRGTAIRAVRAVIDVQPRNPRH